MSAISYSEMYSELYDFEQVHLALGASKIVVAPAREPGTFVEPAVCGPTLQLSLRPRRKVARVDLGAGSFEISPKGPTFIVGPAGATCSYSIPEQIELLIIELPVERFSTSSVGSLDLGFRHSAAFEDEAVLHLARRMWQAARDRVCALTADHLTLGLIGLLSLPDVPHQAKVAHRGGLAPWQVSRLTEFMEDRLASDVSLEDLSRLVDLSTFHLCRAFKASTGLPPHRWRLQRRIERVREMLERTDLPVTEVAAAVGYDDPSQLAAVFRKALGVSPTQYRRERRS